MILKWVKSAMKVIIILNQSSHRRDPNQSIKMDLKTLVTNKKPYSFNKSPFALKMTFKVKFDTQRQTLTLNNFDVIDASTYCTKVLMPYAI